MNSKDRAFKTGEALLPLAEVERRCAIRRSTIYKLMATGEFPRPVRIGSKAVRWRATDLAIWLANLQK